VAPQYLIDECRCAGRQMLKVTMQVQYVIWRPFIRCSGSTSLKQFT